MSSATDAGASGRWGLREHLDRPFDPSPFKCAGGSIEDTAVRGIRAPLLIAIRHCTNQRDCPPLERKLIALRQIDSGLKVLRCSFDLKFEARKRILQSALNQANGDVSDINTDPLTV
jgi:hypothetical protein